MHWWSPAPAYFEKYGQQLLYSVFKSGAATRWYVFYNVYVVDGDSVFLMHSFSDVIPENSGAGPFP